MAESSDRAQLSAYVAGKEWLALVDGELQHEPKLQQQLASVTARLIREAAGSAAIGKENAGPSKGGSSSANANVLVTLEKMSLLSPKGKFDIDFHASQLTIRSNNQTSTIIPTTSITYVAILDNIPKDTKNKVLLLLVVDRNASIKHGKQPLEAVLIETIGTTEIAASFKDGEVVAGLTPVVLCTALARAGVSSEAFCNPEPDLYLSNKGLAAFSAVVKVNSGWVFPIPKALIFIERPAMFIPHVEISSLELGRVSNANSATFDLMVRLKDGRPALEFNQIDRAELGRIQSYISACRLKIYDPTGGADTSAAADEDADEDEDEEDDDFDPEDPESDDGDRRRSKRQRREPGPGAAEEDRADEDSMGDDESADYEDEDDDDDLDLTDEEDLGADLVKQRIQGERGKALPSGSRAGSRSRGEAAKLDFGVEDESEEDLDSADDD